MNQVDQIFRSRLQSESQARSTHTTHNHLLGSSLTELLDEYKSVTTPAELERLAKRYNIDVQKIVSLSKSIASPSVDEGSISRTVGNGGVERISMKVRTYPRLACMKSQSLFLQAKWVEPSIATKLQQSTTPR